VLKPGLEILFRHDLIVSMREQSRVSGSSAVATTLRFLEGSRCNLQRFPSGTPPPSRYFPGLFIQQSPVVGIVGVFRRGVLESTPGF
jgi:hypothetical protein